MRLLARSLFHPQPRSASPRLLTRAIAANAVWREHKILREMEADRLEDLGLTRAEAQAEATKSLWDVPSHWRR